MVLFVPSELESFVWQRRSKENTFVKVYNLDDNGWNLCGHCEFGLNERDYNVGI